MAVSQRPDIARFLSEPARAFAEYGATLAAAPVLLRAPRGDGHPVLVLPGLLADDSSTTTLRLYLRALGHDVQGWGLGRNLGPTAAALRGMSTHVRGLHERSGRRVSVVGWSLGGIFARELARAHPDDVRQIVTLGSPFRLADPRDSRADSTFRRFSRLHVDPGSLPAREDPARPLRVPSTSIYSKLDGIVPWQACVDVPGELRENVAVHASHLGLGHNAAALWVVADRLAQPEGSWRPFRVPALARKLFPAPDPVVA